jgi:aminoglycoside phosphotransferase (APT) family kinase protein
MREHVDGFRGPLEVRQFRGGQSNPTYYLAAGGREYVLRRKPPGKLLPSAHAVDREYRVLAALAALAEHWRADRRVAEVLALAAASDDAELRAAASGAAPMPNERRAR